MQYIDNNFLNEAYMELIGNNPIKIIIYQCLDFENKKNKILEKMNNPDNLEQWLNYLARTYTYPLWFKIYIFESLIKDNNIIFEAEVINQTYKSVSNGIIDVERQPTSIIKQLSDFKDIYSYLLIKFIQEDETACLNNFEGEIFYSKTLVKKS